MKEKTVSVIIPVFNRDWGIREAVDSVLEQTYKNFELIIVDDGSYDNTRKILESYNSKRINVIRQKNMGVSAARNTGIKKASGDYIAFLDSDDKWIPEKLEIQMDYFSKHPEIFVCQTNEIWIRNGKRINPSKKHKKPQGDIFIDSLSLCLVSPSAVMMKKEFFFKAGFFDESMKVCEDYDLWLRAGLLFDFYLIDKECVIKRGGHSDQLSSSPFLDKYRIYSLNKILFSKVFDKEKKIAVFNKLSEKCEIYVKGCIKRNKWEEVFIYRKIIDYWRKNI
ncbi:MAG: glycosyl transferase [Deltaproteobacteria bacterium]|nr:MAG: glycosyl transferase [Deltaproteobacteria bacterium]